MYGLFYNNEPLTENPLVSSNFRMKETHLICALLLSCGAHLDDAGSNSAHTIIFFSLSSA